MERSYGIIPLIFQKSKIKVVLVRLQSGNHWSFPKGHAEPGESPKETASRELFEETGLKVKRYLSDDIFSETYFFRWEGKLIHKQVDYYVAEVTGKPVIQEHEISEMILTEPEKVNDLLTHKEAKKVWESAFQVIIKK